MNGTAARPRGERGASAKGVGQLMPHRFYNTPLYSQRNGCDHAAPADGQRLEAAATKPAGWGACCFSPFPKSLVVLYLPLIFILDTPGEGNALADARR